MYNNSIQKTLSHFMLLLDRYKIQILYILTFLPFIIVSAFNYPSFDDFDYSNNAIHLSFWDAQVEMYNNWNGRYFTTFILSINPLVYGSFFGYKLLPIIFILLLLISTYSLINLLIQESTLTEKLTLNFLILFLYFYKMPSITQGVYWMSGTVCYQLSIILFIFLITTLIYQHKVNNRGKKLFLVIIASVLTIAIVGTNEAAMVLLNFSFILFLIFNYIFQKRINKTLLILLFISICFSIIVLMAPGNSVRELSYPSKHQFFFSIIQSLYYTLRVLFKWTPFLLLMVLIFDKTFIQISKIIDLKLETIELGISKLLVLIVLCFGIITMLFFLAFWAMGLLPPSRMVNLIYFFYIVSVFFIIMMTLIILRRYKLSITPLNNIYKIIIIIIATSFIVKDNNIKNVYMDLITNKGYNYYLETQKRQKLLLKKDLDSLTFKPIINKPNTVFLKDLSTNSDSWWNVSLAKYFDKSSVRISKSNVTKIN